MNIDIVGVPEFQFNLTKDEIGLLMRQSGLHYDATCREASMVGGFIYGWNNIVTYAEEQIKLKATFRQFDIVLKILEMTAFDSTVNRVIYDDLVRSIKYAMKQSSLIRDFKISCHSNQAKSVRIDMTIG